MISSVTTSAYNAFSTIAAKIQATSLWSQLPAQSTVATLASNILFSKYTYAVIGVGIFCAAAKRAHSNYKNYVSTPAYRDFFEPGLAQEMRERKRFMDGEESAISLPIIIASAALTATLMRVILLP